MKIKRIVSALLSVTLIYGAFTLIIAGGYVLSMGFARAATPNGPNPAQVRKDNPELMSPDHASGNPVQGSDTSTLWK